MTADRLSLDRPPATGRSGKPLFYTTEQLGPKRYKTPEGFLVCLDVPIARVGEMTYGPGETPVDAGPDGKVYITRSEKEVFDPASMASIAGKPIADDHPPVDVDPGNWQFYTKGVVMHPRRGTDDQNDLMVADLMIYDQAMIADVDDGKIEVSCGYDPEYFPVLDAAGSEIPGKGEQRNLIYNHLALVERGRCGPRCAIGDRMTVDAATPAKEDIKMSKKSVLRRLRDAFKAKDEEAFTEAMEDVAEEVGGGGDPHHVEVHNHIPDSGRPAGDEPGEQEEMARRIQEQEAAGRAVGGKKDEAPPWLQDHMKSTDDQFKALHDQMQELGSGLKKFFEEEGAEGGHEGDARDEDDPPPDANSGKAILGELEFEAPPGTGDAIKRAKDSVLLEESFQDALAKAEVLAPGIRLPAYDRAAAPVKTVGTIIGVRRTALDLAYAQPVTRGLIDAALSGRAFDSKKMRAGDARTLFNAVAAMQAAGNNARSTDRGAGIPSSGLPIAGRVKSVADINAANRARFGRKSA